MIPTLPAIPLPPVDLMMSELGPRMVAYYQPVADATADAPTFAKVTEITFGRRLGCSPNSNGRSTTDVVPSA